MSNKHCFAFLCGLSLAVQFSAPGLMLAVICGFASLDYILRDVFKK